MAKTKRCPECYGRKTIEVWEEVARSEISVTAERREKICPTCNGTGTVLISNADRIRAMSDEELAEWMAGLTTVGACNDLGIPDSVLCDGECKSCICKWLKQPAEEGTT